jgi:peptide/nickel transport system substrate-binding protein
MTRQKLNRRDFLKASALSAAGAAIVACQPQTVVVKETVEVEKVVKETVEVEVEVEKVVKETVEVQKEVTKVVKEVVEVERISERQAPMLQEMVQAGTLPPLEERLPLEPRVIPVVEEIGTYGGVWHQMHLGFNDRWQNSYKVMERLGKFLPDGVVTANFSKGWEFSNQGRTVTIYLRKGMKWNDGETFSADDILYWWEDVVGNDELSPSKPANMKHGGELAELVKVDDYAYSITFAAPFGAYEDLLPTEIHWQPGHYLQQFHAGYAAKADLDKAMSDAGFDTWVDLYGAKTAFANNPGTPEILSWINENAVDEPIQIWGRNAYFWKVDPEGNQLAYIDRIERTLLPEIEAILLKAIAGEADFESRRIESVENYPTVMENREKGDYRVILEDNAGSNYGTIFFNYSHSDPVFKELFLNRDFRIALSHAIDREEISQLIYRGQAPPSAGTVAIGSPWYEERFRTAFIDYDPDKANELLDSVGLDARDGEGYRLRSDGQRLSMVILVFTPFPPSSVEIQELVKEHWAKVGVEMIVKPTDRQLWVEQVHALEHEIASYIYNVGHKTQVPVAQKQFAPVMESNCHWAPQWGLWYESGGEEGEEPPEEVKQLQGLYEEILSETDAEKRVLLTKDALEILAEGCYMIGIVNESDFGRWMVVKNNLRNIPDHIPGSNSLAFESSQMFFKTS